MPLLPRLLRSCHPHKAQQPRLLLQVPRLPPQELTRVRTVEVEVVEAEEAVEEELDEVVMAAVIAAATVEAMPEGPLRLAETDLPETVLAVMPPAEAVPAEAGVVAARADSSAQFCGLREVCPESSIPYP